MPAEKRNAFLDADESEDDVGGYESEQELQKGGRNAKRRKLDDDDASGEDDAESFSAADDEAAESDGETEYLDKPSRRKSKDEARLKSEESVELPGVSRPLTKKNLVASEAAKKRSGVVYLSRIPPFMKPQKLRSLLEPYGTINRIFLSPEDAKAYSQRVRNGGNKKKSYVDGWVEFVNKKDAKKAVDLLNARNIGGKKGSYYRDDIWNLVYLHGFKWHNLIEQISTETAERETRMRAEISKTTRENKEFERNVNKAKMLDGIQSKAAAKKKSGNDGRNEAKSLRQFEQASTVKNKGDKLPEDSRRVASMLFN